MMPAVAEAPALAGSERVSALVWLIARFWLWFFFAAGVALAALAWLQPRPRP